jgi:aspartate/methionine/tyrosine aminotransferase
MIVLNNPNNPSGAVIPKALLEGIIELARARDIIVLSDEVYRPLFHSVAETDVPPSALSLGYAKTVVTSSMSKAWALAGIRIGWIATFDPAILQAVAAARDYTTISVSQVDDQIAAYALGNDVRPQLIARNIDLARKNLALLDRFVSDNKHVCSWVKPLAGTTAFIQFRNNGEPVDDEAFCKSVLELTKVFFVPGAKCFGNAVDFKGYVRIGFVSETEVLERALEQLGQYLKENLA